MAGLPDDPIESSDDDSADPRSLREDMRLLGNALLLVRAELERARTDLERLMRLQTETQRRLTAEESKRRDANQKLHALMARISSAVNDFIARQSVDGE